jgi:hypothetical protein
MRRWSLLAVCSLAAAHAQWPTSAPEQLPPVTVRWEDPEQREVFVVEGARYACRVATWPARILTLAVDGKDLLGGQGLALGYTDAGGQRFRVAPRHVVPRLNVWRRKWVPATDSRARMNVWNATPFYWDAHLLEIPFASDAGLRYQPPAAKELAAWTGPALSAWRADHACTVEVTPTGTLLVRNTGDDPYLMGPAVDLPGPALVQVRLRTREAGALAVYWQAADDTGIVGRNVATTGVSADGQWHDCTLSIGSAKALKRLRLDPPGNSGTVEIESIKVAQPAAEDPNAPKPTAGELVLHAYPDELRLELRVAGATAAALDAGTPLRTTTQGGRAIGHFGPAPGAPAILAGGDATFGTTWSAPVRNHPASACWVFRPDGDFTDELDPLPANAVEVTGGHWWGRDPVSGLYRVEVTRAPGGFGFEDLWTNPTRRATVGLKLTNGQRARRLVVKCETGIGCLEAAVLTDAHGFSLPTPAFVAKNFAGELEEPDDSAYGDSYFPLSLAPGETRAFRVANLVQNWGNHPLKQVSSIRFFLIYWHLSTGASETTCWSHNWMKMGRSGYLCVPDFRPMSGEMFVGQPQHDCVQWPGFLQYNGDQVKLVYERTVFRSISPCVARFTMHYHTSDDAARASLDVLEIPQRDELRTFVKLRYDWTKPVAIEGDARANLRLVNVFEKKLPAQVLYTEPSGATKLLPVTGDDQPLLLGVPLAKESPFVATEARPGGYHCLLLVRSLKARLGGKERDQLAASARFGRSDGNWWLTVPEERLALQPGDFVEAEVMLMPHGEPTPPAAKPERERKERYGAGVVQVKDVTIGTKLADFPPRVRAADDVAQFSVTGGFDTTPLIVENMRGGGIPLLWRGEVWQDQQLVGGDGYQVEGDGTGALRYLFAYPIRRGQTHRCLVTRAQSSTGIARASDDNGRLVLTAPSPATWHLQAPALFAPGRNEVTPGAPVVTFRAEQTTSVRQAPLSVKAPGKVTVSLDAGGRHAKVTGGPATLTFHGLVRGPYACVVDGARVTRQAVGGAVTTTVEGLEGVVEVVGQAE